MALGKIIACTPEQEQMIYREWGLFYMKKQKQDIADLYYNKSLALNPDDSKALYSRSRCKRRIAQTKDALVDAKKAMALDKYRQPFYLEVCDGIYELNEFEETMYNVCNFSRKFSGRKVEAFNDRIDVLNVNFTDSLGNTLGYFILENEKHFATVYREMVARLSIDRRPLWKQMKEQQKCDVLSILEEEKINLSAIEIARRKRAYAIFNQIYLRRSWIDVLFLKALTTNDSLLLPQSKLSTPLLDTLTKSKYNVVTKLIKMLNARSPLYTEKRKACPSRQRKKQQTESFLFRVQYQVHRSMLKILKNMRRLREMRRSERLRKYVEGVMGEYVVLKIHRVMPWKFQFINEVYNILALALCDKYDKTSRDLTKVPQNDRLIVLLQMDTDVEKEPIPFEFGKRETLQDASSVDKNLPFKALTARLEMRLRFAKYPIEKAYLWHEIARCDLKQNRFDRCCLVAERAIAEAEQCNSTVWIFHATMLMLKTNALLRKIEKVAGNLKKATALAVTLNDAKLKAFLRECTAINHSDIHVKKQVESMRSTRSRASIRTKSSDD